MHMDVCAICVQYISGAWCSKYFIVVTTIHSVVCMCVGHAAVHHCSGTATATTTITTAATTTATLTTTRLPLLTTSTNYYF